MNYKEFLQSIEANSQPEDLSLPLQALWLDRRGNWEQAHPLCEEIPGQDGDWVHAYLHRVEGDEWNAGYWYERAGKSKPDHLSLAEEWKELVEYFLSK